MNTNVDESKVLQVPIEDIVPNRAQPRVVFDDESLQELADSIKEHGIIQPLVLRRSGDKYEIVAGERRYRAAKKAGLAGVPAIITTMTDAEAAEAAIVENIQRKDLTAIEEARSFKSILDKGDLSQADLAKKMGVSQSAISNKLRLLSLDEEVQQAVLESKISERHARSLLKVANKEDQKELLHRVINERLTVKQLDGEIKKKIGDIPLVNSEVDVDKIKNETTDIEPLKIVSSSETGSDEVNTSTDNKFFNFLEESAVNMNVDKPIVEGNPSPAPSPSPEPAAVPEAPVAPAPVIETPQNDSSENIVAPAPTPEVAIPTPPVMEAPQSESSDNIVEPAPEPKPYPEINIPLRKPEEVEATNVTETPVVDNPGTSEDVEMLEDFAGPTLVSGDTNIVDKIKAVLVGKTYTITDNTVNNQQIINIIINN